MSADLAKDIAQMHKKFGVHEWFEQNKHDKSLMQKYLAFRMGMVSEELNETLDAIEIEYNPEEIVDGLIDLCVFAIGTLDVFGVDVNLAWDRVYEANMAKTPGVKESRPNEFGLPDLIKPEGWAAPSHEGNHGHFPDIV